MFLKGKSLPFFKKRREISFGLPVYYNLQDNVGAGEFIRNNESLINNAASEFGIDEKFLKAVLENLRFESWR